MLISRLISHLALLTLCSGILVANSYACNDRCSIENESGISEIFSTKTDKVPIKTGFEIIRCVSNPLKGIGRCPRSYIYIEPENYKALGSPKTVSFKLIAYTKNYPIPLTFDYDASLVYSQKKGLYYAIKSYFTDTYPAEHYTFEVTELCLTGKFGRQCIDTSMIATTFHARPLFKTYYFPAVDNYAPVYSSGNDNAESEYQQFDTVNYLFSMMMILQSTF